jgi:hypothetical protein
VSNVQSSRSKLPLHSRSVSGGGCGGGGGLGDGAGGGGGNGLGGGSGGGGGGADGGYGGSGGIRMSCALYSRSFCVPMSNINQACSFEYATHGVPASSVQSASGSTVTSCSRRPLAIV